MNKKYNLLIVLLLLCVGFLYGQEGDNFQTKADAAYASYNYKDASDMYVKLYTNKIYRTKNLTNLADCYVQLNLTQKAQKIYEQLISLNKNNTQFLIPYALTLKSNGKYAEAKKVFNAYLASSKDSELVLNHLKGCDSALVWIAKPTQHKIVNQNTINTNLSDFGYFANTHKAYFVNEQKFTSKKNLYKRDGNSYLKIFTANINDNYLITNPKLDSNIYNNEKYNVGPLITNKAGNIFIVTTNHEGNKGIITNENKLRFRNNNLELHTYTFTNGKFKSEAFAYNNVKYYSVGHAALSTDEQILYFASNMPGGFGGTDIWFCTLDSLGKWNKPKNAGNIINTASNEMFPSISGDLLFFASNGHIGMGGLDIFKATGSMANWQNVVNLKYPINSAANDFNLFIYKTTAESINGYLSSNRDGGAGGDDIFAFSFANENPPLFALSGKILKKPTNVPLSGTTVSVYQNKVKIIDSEKIKPDGGYYFKLQPESDYTVIAKKQKYQSDSVLFSTKGLTKSQNFKIDLSLDSLFELGKIISLPKIYYDFDKDNIRPDAANVLDGLVQTLFDNPSLKIELRSHTDSRANDMYNIKLSQRRAQSAVNYIVNKGISANRIKAKGYGESKLVNKCKNDVECTDEEHQNNRRTDFEILKY